MQLVRSPLKSHLQKHANGAAGDPLCKSGDKYSGKRMYAAHLWYFEATDGQVVRAGISVS